MGAREKAVAPEAAAARNGERAARPQPGPELSSGLGGLGAGRVLALQRAAGNRAVVSLLAAERPAEASGRILAAPVAARVQRHFARGEHVVSKPPAKHAKHTKGDADKALELTRTLKTEVTSLKESLTTPGTSEQAGTANTRLLEIEKIIRSQIVMVRQVEGVNYVAEMSQVATTAQGGAGTAATTRDDRAKAELVGKVKSEAPAKLRELEDFAMKAADYAAITLKKGAEGIKVPATVQKPAKSAADERDKARTARQALVDLASAAASVSEAKDLAESYLPPADRALDLAQRMADLADSVVVAWKRVFDRNDAAKKTYEKAQQEAKDAEGRLEEAREQVAHLSEYNRELAIDVAGWRLQEGADGDALDSILREADERLQMAEAEVNDLQLALTKAKDNLPLVKVAEAKEVQNEVSSAKLHAATHSGEASTGKAEVEGLADVRDLAGGPGPLETMLALVPDRGDLKKLLEALGAAVTRRWLTSGTIGPLKAKSLVATFGTDGLRALVTGIGDSEIDRLVSSLSVTRLFDLAEESGLGLVHLKEMNLAFGPDRIDAYATEVGLGPLKAFLGDVNAGMLRLIGAEPAKLKAFLETLTSGALKTLITTVGAPGVLRLFTELTGARVAELAAPSGLGSAKLKAMLAAALTPTQIDRFASEVGLTELKAFLGEVPAATLVALDIDAVKLKALLGEMTGTEVKGLITTLTVEIVKGLLAAFTASELKGLLTDLPAVDIKRLKLTGAELKDLLTQYNATQIKGLAADLGDPALKDLLTKFNAAEIKAYRTTVGADRLKHLITIKNLKANALHHYGAAMLKTFVGANATTWGHLAGRPTISNTSGQISGGHDEAEFLGYINELVGTDSDEPRATIDSSTGPGAQYKVTYTTRGGVSGSKTLIRNLATNEATWLPRINNAIWAAIRNVTFAWPAFSASAGGYSFQGYYNGGVAVDTIYPV
ncbi:MAG: hypothetical protein ACRDZ8_11525 [Acidimicrobiales bacterium]